MQVYKKLRKEEDHLGIISGETALKFLVLEQRVLPRESVPIALSRVQEACIESLAASWQHLDTVGFRDFLTQLDPVVLSSILQKSVQQARVNIPKSIVVSGAGTDAVNGVYTRCANVATPFPIFVMKNGHWNGENVTFTLCTCVLRSGFRQWFISITDSEQPGTDRDVDFYTSARFNTMVTRPPTSGWKTAANGVAPIPSLQFVDSSGRELPA